MSGFTASGAAIKDVRNESGAGLDDAKQLAPLGFELTRQSPVDGRGPATTTTGISGVIGVVVNPIGDNGFGFIMKKGYCAVTAGAGTIDINEAIIVDSTTPGTAMCVTGGAPSSAEDGFGFATANANAADTALCYINCRG